MDDIAKLAAGVLLARWQLEINHVDLYLRALDLQLSPRSSLGSTDARSTRTQCQASARNARLANGARAPRTLHRRMDHQDDA